MKRITRRKFLKAGARAVSALLLLTTLAPAIARSAETPADARRPNFVIIFTDDQGYQDLGVFGSPTIKTPNIDRMAEEGRVFTSFYVASPVCSASRAALLTGCYPARLGITKPVFFPPDNIGLHPDEVTIADMLQTAGYATACVGKWHLGHRPPFLPTAQGFDSYFGIPYSNDMSHPDNKRKRNISLDKAWENMADGTTAWHTPLMENEEIIELPVDQRTITRRYTDRAIEFITANKDQPFFLYLAHSMPHIPLFVPDEAHDPEVKNAYQATIEHIDAETGRLLDAIREHGLAETTYVIYTSDNGPWLPKNHHGGSALPLSGGKGWFQEGGIRVPCVIWGPGRIPAGTRTDALAATIDLFPTIAALAGVQPTTRGPIDGLDLSGVIKGESASPRTELLYCSATRNKDSVYLPGVAGMRQGDWKILGRDLDKNPALYNLADDIGEKKNLAATHPDKLAALRARARELETQLQAETRSLGKYRPPARTDHQETKP